MPWTSMYWQPVRTCEAMAHRNLQSKGVCCTTRDHEIAQRYTTDGKINSLEQWLYHICRFNERFNAISPPSFVYSLQQISVPVACTAIDTNSMCSARSSSFMPQDIDAPVPDKYKQNKCIIVARTSVQLCGFFHLSYSVIILHLW